MRMETKRIKEKNTDALKKNLKNSIQRTNYVLYLTQQIKQSEVLKMNYGLLEHVKKNGGATLSKSLKHAEVKGYMVSLKGFEKILKISEVEKIQKDIEEKQKVITKNNQYIGLWLDNDDLYIDISENISDETTAINTGRLNEQIAIYDCNNKKVIEC